tara:strand:+ start:4023 stop:4232 length:210 start_codon:yes stop_codon:yes gene_type:complete
MKANTQYDNFKTITRQIVEGIEYLKEEVKELKAQVDKINTLLKTKKNFSAKDKSDVNKLRGVHKKVWSE